MQACC